MRRTFACLVAAAAIVAGPGAAHAWSTQGAEMLSTSENAADVAIGFPQLRGQFHVPLTRDLAVIPQFTFFYGMDTTVPIVGDGFFAAVRYRVFRSGGLDIALQAEPGIIMVYHPGFALGIQLGLPETVMSYRINPQILVNWGLKMPIAISVHPSPVFGSIPILFNLGGEFAITRDVNLFVNFDLGPDIVAVSGGSGVQFRGVFLFGAAYRF